ncbi:hypothetical protein Thivi_2639 [Thiocystis violascens DSM 198]|uniref:Uncharacterized protein n=1 Tax=Thiocystis violascens (strain ATCC 17096 / DSM 198 / 6111) TaxID=765911 RepID=I3YC52_THIV6|nr:hypothetical protein Thivi_2639 [Thiocystis violascens DSM 198]
MHPANREQAQAYLRHIEEDHPEDIVAFMDGLARYPERLAWLYHECVRLGIATTEIVESIGDRLESEISRAADPLVQLESLNNAFGDRLSSLKAANGSTPDQLADIRRTCRQCRNLARNGRCMVAGRGELPLTGTQYEPDQDRLERCVGFLPTADDPNQ